MPHYPSISNFLTADTTGLIEFLETLAKEKIAINDKIKQIKKLDIKTGLSFSGLTERCTAYFSDDYTLKCLNFEFYSPYFDRMLSIIFDCHLIFIGTYYGRSKTGGHIQKDDRYKFGAILDVDIIKILIAAKDGHEETIKEILPELTVVGVYDFNDVKFKQRVELANMVII